MFKIIKTSTYNNLVEDLRWKTDIQKELLTLVSLKDTLIKQLQLKLHHLTAKKLPIKKSKNK
jgi:hypothetical protein